MSSRQRRISAGFAAQFEPEGAGYLYRKYQKGAAVRVTADERDRFVVQFERWMWWSLAPLMLAFIAMPVLSLVLAYAGHESPGWLFAMIAVVAVPFMRFVYWRWSAPERALAGRPVAAEARSAAEFQRLKFASVSYAKLALALPGAIFIVWLQAGTTDVWQGWGPLWLVFAGGLVAFAGVQALRKWRAERPG